MRVEILFIPMGDKVKGIIKGKVKCSGDIYCGDGGRFLNKTFMTTPHYMKHWFPNGRQGVRRFLSNGRPKRYIIDSHSLFAPYHLHSCDSIV